MKFIWSRFYMLLSGYFTGLFTVYEAKKRTILGCLNSRWRSNRSSALNPPCSCVNRRSFRTILTFLKKLSIQPSAQILAQNHRCSPEYLSIWFRAAAKPMMLLSHGFSEHNAIATIGKFLRPTKGIIVSLCRSRWLQSSRKNGAINSHCSS